MKITAIAVLLASSALAQEVQKPAPEAPKITAPAPSLSDLILEVSKTQRDLLLADSKMKQIIEQYNTTKTEAEGLQKSLQEKTAAAGKACPSGKIFDAMKLSCEAAPKPEPAAKK